MKKILRWIFIVCGFIIGLLLIFVLISIAPIDRTPAQDLPAYDLTIRRIDSLGNISVPKAKKSFSVGFSKVNLTPSFKTATAGYGKRKGALFTFVHDSIYVRTLVVDNGTQQVAIVSADLLIIPPTVTKLLHKKLAATGFTLDNTYLGATHTHNSIGNWGEGATRFLYGRYNDSIVNFIADRIVAGITAAAKNKMPSQFRSGNVSIPKPVKNRLIRGGPEDPSFRMLEIHRNDSSKLLFATYTAHATCLSFNDLEISADYPGKLISVLETKGYDFAMFMAGAVGSHGCNPPKDDGWYCIDWMTERIMDQLSSGVIEFKDIADSTLYMVRVPLALSDPQLKIAQNWKVRAWVFREAAGEYPAHLTLLRLGNLVLMGTPCDFSGEFNASLDSLAAAKGLYTMVTSFNGGYIGYVTPKRYYDRSHYETRIMNWYAPGTGEYIQDCLEKLMLISE